MTISPPKGLNERKSEKELKWKLKGTKKVPQPTESKEAVVGDWKVVKLKRHVIANQKMHDFRPLHHQAVRSVTGLKQIDIPIATGCPTTKPVMDGQTEVSLPVLKHAILFLW